MKHTIHIHQQKLRKNQPAIIDRTWRNTTHHTQLTIHCPNCGTPTATIKQTDTPDKCGARAWIETNHP